jgi:hypothetical protein
MYGAYCCFRAVSSNHFVFVFCDKWNKAYGHACSIPQREREKYCTLDGINILILSRCPVSLASFMLFSYLILSAKLSPGGYGALAGVAGPGETCWILMGKLLEKRQLERSSRRYEVNIGRRLKLPLDRVKSRISVLMCWTFQFHKYRVCLWSVTAC